MGCARDLNRHRDCCAGATHALACRAEPESLPKIMQLERIQVGCCFTAREIIARCLPPGLRCKMPFARITLLSSVSVASCHPTPKSSHFAHPLASAGHSAPSSLVHHTPHSSFPLVSPATGPVRGPPVHGRSDRKEPLPLRSPQVPALCTRVSVGWTLRMHGLYSGVGVVGSTACSDHSPQSPSDAHKAHAPTADQ